MTATFQIFDPNFTDSSTLLNGDNSSITVNTATEIQLRSYGGGTVTLLGSNLFMSFGTSDPGLYGTVAEIEVYDPSGNLTCEWNGLSLDASDLTYGGSSSFSLDYMFNQLFPLTVTGPAQANAHLYGDYGNDTIYGGDGGDYIDGYYGINTIYGGAGNDVIVDSPITRDGTNMVGGYIDGGAGYNTLQLNWVNILEIDDSGGNPIWVPGELGYKGATWRGRYRKGNR